MHSIDTHARALETKGSVVDATTATKVSLSPTSNRPRRHQHMPKRWVCLLIVLAMLDMLDSGSTDTACTKSTSTVVTAIAAKAQLRFDYSCDAYVGTPEGQALLASVENVWHFLFVRLGSEVFAGAEMLLAFSYCNSPFKQLFPTHTSSCNLALSHAVRWWYPSISIRLRTTRVRSLNAL